MAKTHETDSTFLYHEPCPDCGSSDARSVYDDGHTWCFACETQGRVDGEPTQTKKANRMNPDLLPIGETMALSKRGLDKSTCDKWRYTVGEFAGKPVQIANYYDDSNNLIAQKVRFPNKDFKFLGDTKKVGLYGQWIWRDKGKMVVITEGEIDALSVSQLQGNKWPVVSVPNGAAGAKKAIAKSIEWLLGFDSIVLMFDNDDDGMKAVEACASMLPPGRCKVAKLPLKDANEMLVAGRGAEVIDAIWGAKEYRPDGIVTLADIREQVMREPEQGLSWCFPTLTELTYGRRLGEVYALGAGTGVGKTDFLTQQIAHDIMVLNQPVAMFFLEQQPVETGKRIAGKISGKRFHVPDAGWKTEELVDALNQLEKAGKMYLYDHFGATEWAVIRERIRYLAHSEGVKMFYLDHLTALAAEEDDERKALEVIMSEIGRLVKELNIIITLVSHLATPDGRPHEEGGRVMIRHFKGSRAIGFWCHFMFGMERDQQAEEESERTVTTFRVLKDRFTGQATGRTFYLGYDAETGLLRETFAFDVDGSTDGTKSDDIPF